MLRKQFELRMLQMKETSKQWQGTDLLRTEILTSKREITQITTFVILTKCFWSMCFVSLFLLMFIFSGSGSITSVGEERANLSAVVYL